MKRYLIAFAVAAAVAAGWAGGQPVRAEVAGDPCGFCPNGTSYPDNLCTSIDTCSGGVTCRPQGADPCTDDGLVCDTRTLTCVESLLGWGTVAPEEVRQMTGLGSQDPRVIIARVINVILGFLGIIAVILILAGGFIWMTAAGNDDKIAQAKKVMSAGVIGIVIVLAAFGLARFAVDALVSATTAS